MCSRRGGAGGSTCPPAGGGGQQTAVLPAERLQPGKATAAVHGVCGREPPGSAPRGGSAAEPACPRAAQPGHLKVGETTVVHTNMRLLTLVVHESNKGHLGHCCHLDV